MRMGAFRTKIVVSTLLLLMTTLLLVDAVNHVVLSSVLMGKWTERQEGQVRATAEAVDSYLFQRRQTIATFMDAQELALRAYHLETSTVRRAVLAQEMSAELLKFTQANPSIAYAYVYYEADGRVTTDTLLSSAAANEAVRALLCDIPKASRRHPVLLSSEQMPEFLRNPLDEPLILAASMRYVEDVEVIMLCAFSFDMLWSPDQAFAVCDANNQPLWRTTARHGGRGDTRLMWYSPPESEWQYYFRLEVLATPVELQTFTYRQAWASACLLLCFVLLVVFFSKRMVRPVHSLAARMEEIIDFGSERRIEGKSPRRHGASLQARLQTLLALHVLVPALAMQMVSGVLFGDAVRMTMERITLEDMDASVNLLTRYLQGVRMLLDDVALSTSVQAMLAAPDEAPAPHDAVLFPAYNISTLQLDQVEVLDTQMRRIVGNKAGTGTDAPFDALPEDAFLFGAHLPYWLARSANTKTVYVAVKNVRRRIPSTVPVRSAADPYYQNIGYVAATIPAEVITGMLGSLAWDNSTHTVLLTEEDTIFYYSGRLYIGQTLERLYVDLGIESPYVSAQGKYIQRQLPIAESRGWKLLLLMPQALWHVDNLYSALFNSLLFTVLLVAIWGVSYYLSLRMLRPLFQLQRDMALVQTGNFGIRSALHAREDEIALLREAFNHMMDRLQALVEENYLRALSEQAYEAKTHALERSKKEAELISLQSQINPHFLYNTISSITFMIEMGMVSDATDMLGALGRLFRVGMYRGSVIVRLQEELEHVEAYLQIQKLRYRDKLTYALDVPEALMAYGCIKLTLQPLVENAIYHGIEQKKEAGHVLIRVRADAEKQCLYVLVCDDGIGIDPQQLTTIRDALNAEQFGQHIGIVNVAKRIRLYYGQDYGVHIESVLGEGTRITLTIPLTLDG